MIKALKFEPSTSLRIGFLLLLGLSFAQVAWWMGENTVYSHRTEAQLIGIFQKSAEVVNASAEGRLSAVSLPEHLVFNTATNSVEVNPNAVAKIKNEYGKRIKRYYWEGGFFLFVLVACMSFLTAAIRQDAALRRRQSNFLASVSHEFKSPLASIQLAADTLNRRSQDEETQRWAPRIQQDCSRLLRTVENILDSARIEDGQIAVNNQQVMIADVLTSVTEELNTRLQAGNIKLEVADISDVKIETDPAAAETILRNLLDNAVKACHSGEGSQIKVLAKQQGGTLTLTVQDDGMGFPPSDAKLLFEKFYRVGNELQRKTPGTGLGLYITKQLAEHSGAQVTATSDGTGAGAAFHVSWKLSP